jgi:hypothetical protein
MKLGQILQTLAEIPITPGRWSKLQERLNDLQEAVKALARGENLTSGKHIQIRRIDTHTVSISGTPGGTGGADEIKPHQVLSVGAEKIKINNGDVNYIIATPLGEIEHTSVDAYRYLALRVAMSEATGPTSAAYTVLEAPPGGIEWSTGTLPTQIDILIAVIKGTKFWQIRTGNLTVTRKIAHELPKASVSVGEYPYDIYWTWEVS